MTERTKRHDQTSVAESTTAIGEIVTALRVEGRRACQFSLGRSGPACQIFCRRRAWAQTYLLIEIKDGAKTPSHRVLTADQADVDRKVERRVPWSS